MIYFWHYDQFSVEMPKRCRYVPNAPRYLGTVIAPSYLCRIWCSASFDSPAECLPVLLGSSMSSKTWLTFRMWGVLLTSARRFVHTFGHRLKYLAGKGVCVFHFSFVIILIKYLPQSCGSSGNIFTFYSLQNNILLWLLANGIMQYAK